MNRLRERSNAFIYLGLTSLVWLVFGQTLQHQFVAYDDQNYVYKNVEVTLSTHDAGGVTDLDVKLAEAMDRLAGG